MSTNLIPAATESPASPAEYGMLLDRLGIDLAFKRRAARAASIDCGRWARLAYAAGISQVEIARRLGVARSSVIEWIHDDKT